MGDLEVRKMQAIESMIGKITLFEMTNFIIPTLGRNVDLRLLRKLPRWDLRSQALYSTAVVYDITGLARENHYQMMFFMLSEELRRKCTAKGVVSFLHETYFRG